MGDDGTVGSAGPQGAQGEPGDMGPVGPQGFHDADGLPGRVSKPLYTLTVDSTNVYILKVMICTLEVKCKQFLNLFEIII